MVKLPLSLAELFRSLGDIHCIYTKLKLYPGYSNAKLPNTPTTKKKKFKMTTKTCTQIFKETFLK